MLKKTFLLLLMNVGLFGADATHVRGRITSQLDHADLSGVRLTISGSTLETPIVFSSNARGSFEVTAEPGQYSVLVEKAGYFPEQIETNVTNNRDDASILEIELSPQRRISGSIKWSDGEPAVGSVVRLIPRSRFSVTTVEESLTAITDDRGIYYFSALRDGFYDLIATPGGLTADSSPNARFALPMHYKSGGLDSPGALDLRAVRSLTLDPIVFIDEVGVVVEGRISFSSDFPAGTEVLISLLTSDGVEARRFATKSDAFYFENVPAGQYLLVLTIPSSGSRRSIYRTVQSIVVFGSPLSGLNLGVPEAVSIKGVVKMVPAPTIGEAPSRNLSSIKFSQSSRRLGRFGGGEIQVQPTGSFELPVGIDGEMFTLSVIGMPPNMYISSIKQGTRTDRESLEVGAGEDVEITIHVDGGQVKGAVPSSQDGYMPRWILIRAASGSPLNYEKIVSLDRKGHYEANNLPPGDYDLHMLNDQEIDLYLAGRSSEIAAEKISHFRIEPGTSKTLLQ